MNEWEDYYTFDERMRLEHEFEFNLYATILDMIQNGDIVEDFENPQVRDRILRMKKFISNSYDKLEVLLNVNQQ